MVKVLRYIKKYKTVFVIVLLGLGSRESDAQTRKFLFGFNTGYEFASAYYEKHKDLPTNERIADNYSLGLMVEKLNDSSLVSFSTGVYFKYRTLSCDEPVYEKVLFNNRGRVFQRFRGEFDCFILKFNELIRYSK